MRKKDLYLILIIVLLISLTGCGSRSESKDARQPDQQQVQESGTITIVGGSAGGAWTVFTEGVAEAIRKGNPNYNITAEPGKDGPNCSILSQGKVQLALSYYPTVYAALNGKEPYQEKIEDMRVVFTLLPQSLQFVCSEKTGFNSFEDLVKAVKENKYPLNISVNKKGSLMELLSKAVLEAYGITYADIENNGGKIVYATSPEALDMMSVGQLDILGDLAEAPKNFFVEAANRLDLKLLPLSREVMEQVNNKFGTATVTIPKNSYKFKPDDIVTVAAPLIVISSANVSEEMIYNCVSSVANNLDFLRTVNVSLESLDLNIMSAKYDVPFHPGAEKFYNEQNK